MTIYTPTLLPFDKVDQIDLEDHYKFVFYRNRMIAEISVSKKVAAIPGYMKIAEREADAQIKKLLARNLAAKTYSPSEQ